MVNYINRKPASPLLTSSLPGPALRKHVESLVKPCDSQMFSKPCLVNSISKETHLVFSIYCRGDNEEHVSYMHAHVLLNLFNELGKRDKMPG